MEKALKNLKIGKKLIISFSILIAFSVIIAATAIICLIKVEQRMEYFYNIPYQNAVAQNNMTRYTQSLMKNILWACTTTDTEKTTQLLADAQADIDKQLAALEFLKSNAQRKDLIKELEDNMSKAIPARKEAIEYSKQNDVEGALSIFENKYAPEIENALDLLDNIGIVANQNAVNSYNDVIKVQKTATILLSIIILVCLLISTYFCILITRMLTKPIKELELATKQLSEGVLDIELNYKSQDELGILTANFLKTCTFLKTLITDLNRILTNLAEGNFD